MGDRTLGDPPVPGDRRRTVRTTGSLPSRPTVATLDQFLVALTDQ
jgi:hypothetical protein